MGRTLALLVLLIAPPAALAQEYDRSAWRHWTDEDRDCQDTRQEVLIEESLIPPTLDERGCRVVAGLWYDLYTGAVITDPALLDVDHFVPLRSAHDSGAAGWDSLLRRLYANELRDRWHLVAVGRSVNRSKGARGLDAWLPPSPLVRCWYVENWRRIKEAWGLALTEAEAAAIAEVRAACPHGGL